MKCNSFSVDIPVVIIMKVCMIFLVLVYVLMNFFFFKKALSCESDQEIVQLVGTDSMYLNGITNSIEQCYQLNIFTKEQALVSF